MKRIILLFIICSITSLLFAQTSKQNKYIKKYDVLQYLPNSSDHNPATFWELIRTNNKEFQNTLSKFIQPKGSAKQATKKIDEAVARIKKYRNIYQQSPEEKDFNHKCKSIMIGDDNISMVSFNISSDDEWNAYCSPDGYVTINLGLIKRLNRDTEMIYGILAHEVCHYMYKHMLIHEYKSIKKEKQNMLGAAFGAAGTAVGNIALASAGVQKDYDPDEYLSFFDNAKQQTDLARFKYSREEETEADIVAYRFMEWMGMNPNKFIEALERINQDNLITKSEIERDHPTMEFRISLLKRLNPAPWTKE